METSNLMKTVPVQPRSLHENVLVLNLTLHTVEEVVHARVCLQSPPTRNQIHHPLNPFCTAHLICEHAVCRIAHAPVMFLQTNTLDLAYSISLRPPLQIPGSSLSD